MKPSAPRLGGQAVIEGVMVRAGARWVVAARRPDGEIEVHEEPVPPWAGRGRRVPIVRGVIALASTVALGMRALAWSRRVAEHEEPAARSAAGGGARGRSASRSSTAAATVVSIAVFVAIFAFLPAAAARAVTTGRGAPFAVAEALARLALLVGYGWAIGRLPRIRRTYEYHGAEHQAIAAAEAGDVLDLDHVRRYSPRHARCGTDFLMLVALVAIVVFALVSPHAWWALALSRVLLLPGVAGAAYEVLRVADRPRARTWLRPVMAPGMAVQRLTTRAPSNDQLAVAIAAVRAALEPAATPA